MSADWDQAYWAAAAALAAWMIGGASLVVSGVTLWFLKRQLDANRQALQDAARSADAAAEAARMTVAAERPWLKLNPSPRGTLYIVPGENGEQIVHLSIDADIVNAGRTPAIDVRLSIRVIEHFGDQMIAATLASEPPIAQRLGVMFPGDVAKENFAVSFPIAQLADYSQRLIILAATYRMTGSARLHQTPEVRHIMPGLRRVPETPVYIKLTRFSSEQATPT